MDRKGPERRKTTASERIRSMIPNDEQRESPMMSDIFKLLDTYEKNGQNTNFKFLSPKFGSVIQDKRQDMR